MPDPIQVERNFQQVMAQLESTLSIRHRYKLFRGFCKSLDGSFKKYESYILQLLGELSAYSGPLSWSGLDPSEIEEDLLNLESIYASIDLLEETQSFSSVYNSLHVVCLLLYACLNEPAKVDDYLKKIADISFINGSEKTDSGDSQNGTLQKLSDHITANLQADTGLSKDQHSSLTELHQQISQILKPANGSILIPVAEFYERDKSEKKGYGRLRKMGVDLYGEAEGAELDELFWATNIYGAETPSLDTTKDVILASRKLYESSGANTARSKYYKGGIRFENTAAIHNGNSANLAISALWFIRLLKANGERERYGIHPHTVLTGDIDQEGNVKEVDKGSIELKVRAAFFSWAGVLLVPFSQRSIAERELEILRERFPGKSLSIIGVSHLREVFYDRRVASYHIQGKVAYFINRLKREHSKFILIPSIILLLLIIARLAYGPIDHNPQNFSYEGSSLILENHNGAEVDRLEVGTQTASLYSSPGSIAAYPLAILSDLNGDDINEVIYGKRNRLNQSNREVSDVVAYSVSGDSVIWSNELILNYKFPRQSGVTQEEMLIREIGLVETKDGAKIAVNANSYYYFQTILYLIDAKSGKIEAEYLHIGHIRDIIFEDINGDERSEIIFTGINNAHWLASVGVLEIDKIHGHSPLTEDYRPANMEPASELYYILIPKTLLAKYTNPIMKYNEGKTIYFDIANRTIRALVEEARIPFRKEFGEVMVSISFDENLKPVGVGTSDVYDIVAKQLYEEGEIDKIPDYDYFQSYQDSIRYWNGSEFVITQEYFNE